MAMSERARTTAIGVAAIAIFLFIASLWVSESDQPARPGVLYNPVARVSERAFDVYVTETAELDAGQSVLLSTDLPSNRGKAVFLVAEGDLVEAGDLVARFDATPFAEDLQKIERDIREQEIKLRQARADLALHETGSEDRAAQLEHDIELARIKLDSLTQGSIPIRIAQAEKEVRSTRSELHSAGKLLATEKELWSKGLTKQKTLTEAQERGKEAAAAHSIAEHQLRVLNEVTLPAERRQAELQLSNSEREVAVYRQTYAENLKKQKATIAQIQNKIESLGSERERTLGYLQDTELKAPVSGLVLYKTVSIQGEKRKVQVGDSMWNRQGFAVIPDLSSMVAYVDISENEVGKLALGQRATIRPEAYPRLSLAGTVESVGTLAAADAQQSTRYFRVRIGLDETDIRLRPGMSARASVLVRSFEQATLVPVEAVFYDEQRAVGFLWRGGDPLRVPLVLGFSDGKHVVVEEGLKSGQEVMLVYPDSFDVSADAEG